MLDRIFPHNWMALPSETRTKLRALLLIPCTGHKEVRTEGSESTLISDGTTEADLTVITKEALTAFLGKKALKADDFPCLWQKTVNIVEGKTDLGTGDNGAIADKKDEEPIQKDAEDKGAVSGGSEGESEGKQAAKPHSRNS